MSVDWKLHRPVRVEDLDEEYLETHDVEIWEGELIEMSPAGRRHDRVAAELAWLLRLFARDNSDLEYSTDNDGFLVGRNPDVFLCPDAALYRARPRDTHGPWHGYAPELAVEVVSRSNDRQELARKRELYFQGGAEQVWIVDPQLKSLSIYYPDGRVFEATSGEICADGIAKGLVFNLDTLFAENPYEE